MADGVRKRVYPYVFGRFRQFLQNQVFDASTHLMRKGRNGEKKWGGKNWEKIITFIVATNVVANRPPKRQPTDKNVEFQHIRLDKMHKRL